MIIRIMIVTMILRIGKIAIVEIRPCFILRIVRPRIFESKLRNHCAKKLVGALRKPTSFM